MTQPVVLLPFPEPTRPGQLRVAPATPSCPPLPAAAANPGCRPVPLTEGGACGSVAGCERRAASLLGCVLAAATSLLGQNAPTIAVQVDQPGAAPTQYGVFFEDINYGGDGGLYPERVKNRSFEFTQPLMGWKTLTRGDANGQTQVLDRDGLNANNPHFLRVTVENAGEGFGLSNEGFFGVSVQKGAPFTFSVYARTAGSEPVSLLAEIEGEGGAKLASAKVAGFGPTWKQHRVELRPSATAMRGRFNLVVQGRGAIDLDMVSLFPKDTWKKRPNGLRADLVKWLADLKPAFMRFPGGCIVEGRYLSTRYQWKTTIGDVAERRLIVNRWNDEFRHRPAPDYFQSFGLGFYEYFQLCEDIGAAPLPILNCGMACQFNSAELVPVDQLDPFIQDALDLIEFANGPVASPWGSRRAALGHPAPFNLTLLGVGNEQWGPEYIERYARFAQAIKARHPRIQLVSSAGPRPADDLFQFAWPRLRELKADIVDEHCYDRPEWFFNNAGRYDNYDRNGPKVFMGEYAAQSVKVVSPENRNNWECALAEAAYMIGLERNSAVVTMSSYAPLFGHVEGWQWTPNLIWCDNLRSYGTPNYYVQQMFSVHRGDAVLPVQVAGQPAPTFTQPGLYATASRLRRSGEIILKVVNNAEAAQCAHIRLEGAGKVAAKGTAIVLQGTSNAEENSLARPLNVAPATSGLTGVKSDFDHTFPPRSMTVLRLAVR